MDNHILFIFSSVIGYLDCFHFVTLMYNAPINLFVKVVCGNVFIYLAIYIAVKSLGHLEC